MARIHYKRRSDNVLKRALPIALSIVLTYCTLSLFVYSLRHPEQTQTQVFLHFVEAVTWQK